MRAFLTALFRPQTTFPRPCHTKCVCLTRLGTRFTDNIGIRFSIGIRIGIQKLLKKRTLDKIREIIIPCFALHEIIRLTVGVISLS